MKKLILFSGGFDSTILLLNNLEYGDGVTLMYVDYGQAVAPLEIKHAKYWAEKHGLHLEILTLPKLSWSKSTMIEGDSTGDEWEDEYVEMRNLIFISYAMSYAESKGIEFIELGFLDVTPYPDTSPIFIDLMDMVGKHSNGVRVSSPTHHMTKEALFEFAKLREFNLEEIFEHTITCNVPTDGNPCGKCTGCLEIEKFKSLL